MILTSIKLKTGETEFFDDNGVDYNAGDKVIVNNEIGTVVTPRIEVEGDKETAGNIKRITRLASEQDILQAEENEKRKKEVIKLANKLKDKHRLEMKFVEAEFTGDGSKVVISFVCEDRVDFRELVKDLANELKIRIELKQIGIRDQAKAIGALGMCGQECCCRRYLNEFDKVSIKMAKTQGLSLNPIKISGVCGRLMCCLSYENEHYAELNNIVPKINSFVSTPDGDGVVIYNALLKKKVTVRISQGDSVKINEYDAADVKIKSQSDRHEPKNDKKNNGKEN